MPPRVRINGKPEVLIDASDRGLAYGDGLFETIRVEHGHAPLWLRHMTRLRLGCERLGLPLPDPAVLWRELESVADGLEQAVVRITWTRGSGPRGYMPSERPVPGCIVSAAPLPSTPADWYHRGLRLHLCRTRLACQPALAGIKHLNRLEQVLARAEWRDSSIAEGLMLNMQDRVVSATAANLCAVFDGQLFTPSVDSSGVAGTARAELLERHPETSVGTCTLADLEQADEWFLISSVRGILPVRELDGRVWPVGPVTRCLQAEWQSTGLAGQVAA